MPKTLFKAHFTSEVISFGNIMASGFYGAHGSGISNGGAWNNRFKTFDNVGARKNGGQTLKHVRYSTDDKGTEPSTERLNTMKTCMDKFKEQGSESKLESIYECLQDIKFTNGDRPRCTEHTARGTHEQLKLLSYKSIDIDARSRRSNLIFRGICEEKCEDSLVVVQNFLQDRLDIDPNAIHIHRAHRIGRLQTRIGKQVHDQARYRPIIAAFRDFNDVKLILDNTQKLRGTVFGVYRDLPQELITARKPIWARIKSERQANPQARFLIAYPAKLIMDNTVIMNEFPDWQTVMRQSRIMQHDQEFIDLAPSYRSKQISTKSDVYPVVHQPGAMTHNETAEVQGEEPSGAFSIRGTDENATRNPRKTANQSSI